MNELFWWQAGALFWGSVCFFRAGAHGKGIAMSRKTWIEIAQAACIVVAVFALLTEGRGCSSSGSGLTATCVGQADC